MHEGTFSDEHGFFDTGDVAGQVSYYDSNWVWFGMALHLDELPNLNVSEE